MCLMLPIHITRLHADDAFVCSINLRSRFLEQSYLFLGVDFGKRGIKVLQVWTSTLVVSIGGSKRSSLVGLQQLSGLEGFLDEFADTFWTQIIRVEETIATVEIEVDGER